MDRCTFSKKNQVWLIISSIVLWLNVLFAASAPAEEQLDYFDQQVLDWAQNCAVDVTKQIELSLVSGTLNVGQIFDTFYIPIPKTNPQKYRTQYDQYFDEAMRPVIDGYQKKNSRIFFAIAVDRNGYLPTHNTKYAQPITGDTDYDAKWNRTKRIFNDTTGLAAASNKKPYLLQKYTRDTGEVMSDLSVPIYINGQHWGAVRFGYK
jgi:methyl-accepting chemotaxis protein